MPAVGIAFDTETGGLKSHHALLSAGLAIFDENGEILDKVRILTIPDGAICCIAAAINGYGPPEWEQFGERPIPADYVNPAWASDAIPAADCDEIMADLMSQHFGGARPPVTLAYNSSFDFKVAQVRMPRFHARSSERWTCVYQASRRWIAAVNPGSSGKLVAMCKNAGYEPPDAHDSLEDVVSCLKVAQFLVQEQHRLGMTFFREAAAPARRAAPGSRAR